MECHAKEYLQVYKTQEISDCGAGIEQRSASLVAHEGKVMQILCRNEIRVSQNGSMLMATRS